jgi:tetratricopeptide (TPR) repeat protein
MMNIKSIVIACTLMLCISISVKAQDLSQFTAGKVQRAHHLQQDEKLSEAITLLAKLNPSRAYDKAFVKRMLGIFYWQNGNTKSAIVNLSYAVDSGLLNDAQAWVTQRMLADIFLSEQQFISALPHYYMLSKNIPDNQKADELWLRIAQSHYQIEEWDRVLSALKQFDKFNKKVDVQPLTIKLGAQLQLKHWKGAIATLNGLIDLEPNKTVWWQQLAGIQIRIGRSNDALDTLALAKHQGVELRQQDLKTLAQLYAQRGIPERAAMLFSELDGAASDAKLLSEQAMYWQVAKEWNKAISTWSKAAELDNQYRWKLAQLLLQEGHCRRALVELDRVKETAKKADVELAKVRAYYKLEDFERAIIHAKQANNMNSSSASKSWIRYLTQIRDMQS